MDCHRDLEFNGDSAGIDEKTKESILLMKKKMLRSHDLILQYNNKLKECERLKGDLCLAQEEVMKLKRESNANLAKVVKLELLNTEHKKCQQDLERQLADKDVLIASDKCHLQQLVCKVEDIEDKHSEKLMEVELEKSSLEVKVKNLEQELKALRKSHLTEVNKLEKTINGLPPKTRKGAIKVVKDTKDIGVNTAGETERAQPVKPATVEKGVLTMEFYHITDNPYPLFCDKCESSVEPSVEKICKIMTAHPPLLTEMLSPVRRREIPSVTVSRSRPDSRAFDLNDLKFGNNGFRRKDLVPSEASINEFNQVDPISRSSVSPFESTITNFQPLTVARPMDTLTPELENIRRKLETLERKIKKRKRQKSASDNCCNQSRSVSCCGHGQSYANQVPNSFNNGQLDMLTEFCKRMAMFTNEPASTPDRPRKSKKKKIIKLRRLKKKAKLKNTKKSKKCGSTGWEIESEDCETEINVDLSESQNSHILRIKPNDIETTESSPVKAVSHRVDRSTKKGSYIETASNRASPVKVPDKPENNGRNSVSSFSDVEDVRMDDESSRHETAEKTEQTSNARFPKVEIKYLSNSVTVSNSSDGEMTNISHDTAESAYFSQNSAGDETTSMSHEADLQANPFDMNFKAVLPTEKSVLNSKKISGNSDSVGASQNSSNEKSVSVCSDTDLSDVPAEEDFDADLQDQLIARKRKRSCSPKVTKRTTRSMKNLFGKIRALKKNTVTGAVKTQRSNSYETRNRQKITNGTETEEHEGGTVNTDRTSLVLESEPDARVPAKKQRIAHVPKNESASEEQENPPTRKSRQAAKQISQNTVEKSSKCPKPTTRRSILNDKKSEENNTKSGGESLTLDNQEIVRPTLPVGATEICRRERTRAKRNSPMDSPLPLKQPAYGKLEDSSVPKFSSTSSSTESPASPRVIEVSSEIWESPENHKKVAREIFNDHQDAEKTADISESPSAEKNQIGQSLTGKISKSIGTKLTEISDTDGAAISEPDSRKMLDADDTDISEPDSRRMLEADGAEISESDSRKTSDADGPEISEPDNRKISHDEEKNGATFLEKLDASSESGNAETAEEQPISEVSLTDLNQIAKDPKAVSDESEVRSTISETIEVAAECAPPTGTEEIDSPESPASCSSPEKFPTYSATSALSPIRSPLYSNVKLTESSTPPHPEPSDEKSSIAPISAKNLDFTDPSASSEDLPSLTKSILFAKLTDVPLPLGASSKNLVSPPKIPDDSRTAKPESTPRLFTSHQLPAQTVLHPKNRQQRLPIYNKALLPIHPQLSSTSTLPDESSTRPTENSGSTICFNEHRTEVELPANATSNSISLNNSADKPADVPKICRNIQKVSLPSSSKKELGRVPVVYDTTLLNHIDAELDSEIDSSPRCFGNNSDAKKKKKPAKSPANDCPEATKVLKELRSRQVLSSPATPANQRNSPAMKTSKEETVDCKPYLRKIPDPGTFLGSHLGEQRKKLKLTKAQRIGAIELFAAAEKTVKAELDKLVESEEWTSELHQSVIARLREVPSRRTVAKSILDLLVERAALGEELDRTHTPPAPVMTKSQQRIAALLSGLDRDGIMPGVFELVQDGIEFTLFRLGHTPEVIVIEGLVRIFTAMARMKKDRERVRILCCDSLYCLVRSAFTVIYTALTVWPEVFPMHGSCEDELPNCIAHLIKIEECSNIPAPKVMQLKRMITSFYDYPQFQASSGVIITGLIQALRKNYSHDLETAVLLIAKKEGPDWTHDNIINGGLMKIINDSSYPSSFNAISLLGFLVRSFPLADPQGVMAKIGEKLYEMIESGEGTPGQQEGVVSALLSLSRRTNHFNKIADIVLNWKPSQTMQIRTTEQLIGFFKMRSVSYWNQRNQLKLKNNNTVNEKNNRDEKKASQRIA